MNAKIKRAKPLSIVSTLSSASVVAGDEPYRPTTDTAFDIETAPLSSDSDSLLSAETARVAAIGYYEAASNKVVIAYDQDEAAMLRQFWAVFCSVQTSGAKLLGFNIQGFDLPFLIRRSWHHGVSVPKTLMSSGGRYWCDTLVDLMILWRCGSYKDFISLDAFAKFLGVGQKTGSGEFFYLQWQKDRQAAIDYLTNDVRLVIDAARQMNLCPC